MEFLMGLLAIAIVALGTLALVALALPIIALFRVIFALVW